MSCLFEKAVKEKRVGAQRHILRRVENITKKTSRTQRQASCQDQHKMSAPRSTRLSPSEFRRTTDVHQGLLLPYRLKELLVESHILDSMCKGSSMGFQFSTVDYVFVVSFGAPCTRPTLIQPIPLPYVSTPFYTLLYRPHRYIAVPSTPLKRVILS